VSSRSTLAVLLGLHALSEAGIDTGYDLSDIFMAVFEDPKWISAPADLGLLIWASALCIPSSLPSVFRWIESNQGDVQHWRTRDLAIVLAGLAHAQVVSMGNWADLSDLAVELYHAVEERQSEVGLFGCVGRSRSVRNFWGGRFGVFSDQAFCIYSLAKFAQAFEVEEPLDAATSCADTLCKMQGPLGQWWCLYDKNRGSVARAYPVLSEYQGGLAPMAFLALAEATGRSFHEPILQGLRWFFGANEAAIDLGDGNRGPIWDSIGVRGMSARARNYLTSLIGIPRRISPEGLAVCRNIRPEVFGWLLYAFGAFGFDDRANQSGNIYRAYP
jgi:hypothetical protein